jgi:hypothetical protein
LFLEPQAGFFRKGRGAGNAEPETGTGEIGVHPDQHFENQGDGAEGMDPVRADGGPDLGDTGEIEGSLDDHLAPAKRHGGQIANEGEGVEERQQA